MAGAWWELVAPTRPVGARIWSPMQPAEACGRLGMDIAEPAADLHGEEEDKEERAKGEGKIKRKEIGTIKKKIRVLWSFPSLGY